MFLSNVSIGRPVFTTMVILGLVLFGLISYTRMGVDLFPEIDFPIVAVTTTLEGANAEVMDTDVTDVLEEEINTIEGIDILTSVSSEGVSQITVQFLLEKDIDIAAQDVREKVALARRNLPKEIDPPIVNKFDVASNPIMWISVFGDKPYREIADFAKYQIKERLQTISGVGSILLGGFRDRQIRIWLDNIKMEAHSITVQDIIRALQTKNVEIPGGRIESVTREFMVSIKGEFERPEDFNKLVIAVRNGSQIMLQDVGNVEDASEDERSIARFNRKLSVGLGVRRQSGTNAVAVADRVKEEIELIKATLPEGIDVKIAFDSSKFIKNSIEAVQFDVLYGALLTSLVILFFLRNISTTLISVIAIPTSLIGVFSLMNVMGFTINNMTMLGLSLAVGMVIDDAIVVLENIFRHVEEGGEPFEAASTGVSEIALAVMAATFSIAAVFIPVAFMKGIIGRFFFEFGLTITFAILLSLFISFTLTPMLCSRFMRYRKSHGVIYMILERFFQLLDSLYRATLRVALRHRLMVVLLAIVTFVGGLFVTRFIGKEFSPSQDRSGFVVRIESPLGSSVKYSDEFLKRVEAEVFRLPEISHAFAAIGLGQTQEVNKGLFFVTLKDRNKRDRSQQEIMVSTREKLSSFPGLAYSVEEISLLGGGARNAAIQFVITGPSTDKLSEYSEEIMRRLTETPGFVDIDSDFEITKPVVNVFIDRNKANDLDVDVHSLASTIQALIGGINATKFKEKDKRYDVRVRSIGEYRENPMDIDSLLVRSSKGHLVRLSNLVRIEEGAGPNLINRYNRERSVTIFANLDDIPLGTAQSILNNIASQVIPKDSIYKTSYTGRGKAFIESFEYLLFALILAVIVVYMVLAAQFESFIHPFTVMLSLPLCLIGAIGALLVTGSTLNIMSYIGIVMLMGIVTKNAILLVDYTNTLIKRGRERNEAVLEAGPVRLRPILMTAITTIVAVLPVALAYSEGSEARAPMARAVIGGMATSTFLTLLVVPVVYTLFDDLGNFIKRIFGKKTSGGFTDNAV
ncbi:MAG: efflux RND transporter permease subunit [Thermodesulfobacteriota bacterium]|nr:efflux RND transporter permease subunit [Thermodesulfobacteriota bacterium]